jgi:signal transduction histidine kinase
MAVARQSDDERQPRAYAEPVSAIYAWLRRHPILVDGVLAAALALFMVGNIVRRPLPMVPLTLLMVVPVAYRRRAPLLAFALAALSGAGQIVLAAGPSGSDLAVLVLLYTVAAYRPRRESVTALAICLIGSAVAVAAWAPDRLRPVERLFTGTVMFAGPALIAWVLGDSMRYRRAYYVALEDRAARLEAERDAQAKVAAAAERARIARELHDVIAHNVSVMVVQADGAGYALSSDPERARAAIAAIAATGRQALTEMRRLLGVLRTGDEDARLAPLPGLGDLRGLLDQARAAGLSVSFRLEGARRGLPEGAELAAYRVVQESLTNIRKHAGPAAAAAVSLRYQPDCLVVGVTDNGVGGEIPAGSGGHGIAGMRERAEMYAGTVQAGPAPGGGFRVVATLPYGPAAKNGAATPAGQAQACQLTAGAGPGGSR